MGSRDEFFEAVKFVEKHKIRPFVHVVLPSLESAEEGFELMKQGGQFGRVSFCSASLSLCMLTTSPSDRHECRAREAVRQAVSDRRAFPVGCSCQ